MERKEAIREWCLEMAVTNLNLFACHFCSKEGWVTSEGKEAIDSKQLTQLVIDTAREIEKYIEGG